jgi:polyhydroxyalkanoate synthesis regulator phasin
MDKKLEHLFYAVLGGALVMKEKLEAGNEELKAFQEKSEQAARSVIDELSERGAKEKEQLKAMLKDTLKEVISELDLATRQDLEKLQKGLEK